MCGINGIVFGKKMNSKELVSQMNSLIIHRGPDDQRVSVLEQCTFGHVRLSIVDLVSGHQPMQDKNAGLSVVFNGEIYGFKEIRKGYKEYGFQTESDTELLLAMYIKHGKEMLQHLPGMFAFAMWDDKNKQLFCARDRFGEKPFYYAKLDDGGMIFSSEIKAIVKSGLIKPEISKESLRHYLKHLYVHPTRTIYSNIHVLPPAHFLTYDGTDLKIKRYWNLPKVNEQINLYEGAEQFKYLFDKAIQKQLVSDAPLGAFLSGGFDSTLVVSVASKLKENLSTYSFGFDDQLNELPFAKIAAQKYQTRHTEIEQNSNDIASLILEMSKFYDEPFADSSNIPTYLISKEAAKHQKVILTGDGGDELMGGYRYWYRPLIGLENFKFKNNPFYESILFGKIARKLGNNNISEYQNQKKIFKSFGRNIKDVHEQQNNYFNEAELNLLCNSRIENSSVYSFEFSNTVSDAMKMDIENYMPGDILVKTDRASMANSLELRAPFLDVELAEFLISVPYSLKLNSKEEKLIAKYAFPYLPKKITKRAKQGFGAPVDRWLAFKDVEELTVDILKNPNSKLFEFVDYTEVQKYVTKRNYQTWILLNLAVWFNSNL